MRSKSRNRELEAEIVRDPNSPDAYLVYGDWLLEQGEDLGELVSVQSSRVKDPENTELIDREKALIAEHGRRWLGYFAKYEHSWRFGFVDRLLITEATREDLVELLDLVAARFLRELDLELLGHRTFENCNLISALAEVGTPPITRKLTLAPRSSVPRAVDIGSLRAIWPRLSRIEDLTIKAGSVGFAEIALPNATAVSITTNAFRPTLAPLLTAYWPKLTTFALEFTAYPYERMEIEMIEPLLLALGQQNTVRHLAITQHWRADTLLPLLRGVPLFKSLTTLSLTRSAVTNEVANAFIEDKRVFDHLEKIDLRDNYLSKETVEALKKLYGDRMNLERQTQAVPAYGDAGEYEEGDGEADGADEDNLEEAPPAPPPEPTPAGPPRLRNPIDDEEED